MFEPNHWVDEPNHWVDDHLLPNATNGTLDPSTSGEIQCWHVVKKNAPSIRGKYIGFLWRNLYLWVLRGEVVVMLSFWNKNVMVPTKEKVGFHPLLLLMQSCESLQFYHQSRNKPRFNGPKTLDILEGFSDKTHHLLVTCHHYVSSPRVLVKTMFVGPMDLEPYPHMDNH